MLCKCIVLHLCFITLRWGPPLEKIPGAAAPCPLVSKISGVWAPNFFHKNQVEEKIRKTRELVNPQKIGPKIDEELEEKNRYPKIR